MAIFIIAAVLIASLVLGGALWPLWRHTPRTALGLLAALGVCSFALYRIVGTPQGLEPQAAQAPVTLDAAVIRLKDELQRNPQAAEGWQLLGRALTAQGKPEAARDAFDRAAKLLPDNADALVEAAQSRSLADPQRRLDDTAVAMLEHALQTTPTQQRARWLLGVAQRQRGQPAQAASTWQPLLGQVDPATANSLREQINAARTDAGQPVLTTDTGAATSPGEGLVVEVSMAPDLPADARRDGHATVFVIARQVAGPPMPVAVQKHSLQALPLRIILSDADSPMPTVKLSALKEVELVARLSRSGTAQRGEDDLESAPVRVALPARQPIKLVIGTTRP